MSKYSKTMVDKIVELYSTGRHSIKQICEATKINLSTYHAWRNDPEKDFSNRLKKADADRLDNIKGMATKGLVTLLEGKEYDEVQTTEEHDGKVTLKVTNKVIMPNPTSVIFALSNADSGNFQQKQKHEHGGIGDQAIEIIITKPEDDGNHS